MNKNKIFVPQRREIRTIVMVPHAEVTHANRRDNVGWTVHSNRTVNVHRLQKDVIASSRSHASISVVRIRARVLRAVNVVARMVSEDFIAKLVC